MPNLKEMIDKRCKEMGERVVSFVVGMPGGIGETSRVPHDKLGKLLSPEDLHLLDFEVDGVHESYAVYVWTDKSVLFLVEYCDWIELEGVPRNPTLCEPQMFG